MVEAMGLKIWHWGHLEVHALPTEFHENLPTGLKVKIGDTQYNNFTSLTSLLRKTGYKVSHRIGTYAYDLIQYTISHL
jgi:hypothetical protein